MLVARPERECVCQSTQYDKRFDYRNHGNHQYSDVDDSLNHDGYVHERDDVHYDHQHGRPDL